MIPLKDNNPISSFPIITILIITVNCIIFFYQSSLSPIVGEIFIFKGGAIPYEIVHFTDIGPKALLTPPLTLLTAIFIHGSFVHLAGNMLYLWIFGNNIEDSIGHVRFIIFYILAGVLASFFHILTNIHSTIPMVGASGAIAGILGAYFILHPRAEILTLIFFFFFIHVVRIPAVIFLGLWFLFQILSSHGGGGVAWYAHIGGFITGVIMIFLFRKKRVRGKRLFR
jgi:membrane associated rhomboid family serine protease